VIELIADGLPYEEIATRLLIGIETVRSHVRKASARLGAGTRTELVATALRHGLIQ
jgi:DNA-binding CsgD family transcriptional regulator